MVKKIAPDGTVTVYLGVVEYEISGGPTETTSYYNVPGARVVRVNTTLSYVLTDHLGSSSVTLDDGGGINGELRYYAYGETRVSTGATPTERMYTGQLRQDDIGLDYFAARWYMPAIGRFVSADTIVPGAGNPQSFNRYSYAHNRPLVLVDPSGHCSISVFGLDIDVPSAISVLCPGNDGPDIKSIDPHEEVGDIKSIDTDFGGWNDVRGGTPLDVDDAPDLIGPPLEMPDWTEPPMPEDFMPLASMATSSEDDDGGLYKRPKFRKGTVQGAIDDAPRDDEGNVVCPTCGDVIPPTIEIETKNGPVSRRGGDTDHYPDTWAERVRNWKAQSEPPTRQEVIDDYNQRVRYQCPPCNQGHKFEHK